MAGGDGDHDRETRRSTPLHPGRHSLMSPRIRPPPRKRRFGEPQKFVPVAFVIFTIIGLWTIYVVYHCIPMLQLGQPQINEALRRQAVFELLLFHYFTVLLIICYARSIIEHPGEIPENDPHWEYMPADGRSPQDSVPINLQEMKRSGERRHCKWCGKYKPDRCHHCRVCKTCILKMDHHCPWIYNCVGFKNYKFFFLLLLYSVCDCFHIVITMRKSVMRCVEDASIPFASMFLVLFGFTLAGFLAVLLTMFFGFHIWLMMKAMTTIEFCEKSLPKRDTGKTYSESVYDLGLFGNMRAVLGSNVLLWLFPCARPEGDGLNFVSDEARLTRDLQSGRGMRKRTHQRTQRVHGPRQGDLGSSSSYGLPYDDSSAPRYGQ